MRVHKSTTMHVCGAADAWAGVLFLWYCREHVSKTDMEEKKLLKNFVLETFHSKVFS